MDQNAPVQEGARDAALRSIALIARGDRSDFAAVIAPDAVNHESVNEPPSCRGVGPDAFHETAIWLRDAFADLVHEVEHTAVEGDLVAVDTAMKGRHTGPFVLYDADGRVETAQAPTGRSFTSRQTHWFRIADGQVTEHWAVRDDLGQALQLGWVPPTPLHLLRSSRAKRRALRADPTS
jgi:ketosteroid isomerase-like protein